MAPPTLPAAVAAVLSISQAAVVPLGLAVFDGQPTVSMPAEFVSVEHSDTKFGSNGRQAPAGLGAGRRAEQYDIRCLVSAFDANASMAAARTRAWAAFTAISDAVRADNTLGGVVIYAEITDWEAVTAQIDAGANYTIEFAVSVQLNRI